MFLSFEAPPLTEPKAFSTFPELLATLEEDAATLEKPRTTSGTALTKLDSPGPAIKLGTKPLAAPWVLGS